MDLGQDVDHEANPRRCHPPVSLHGQQDLLSSRSWAPLATMALSLSTGAPNQRDADLLSWEWTTAVLQWSGERTTAVLQQSGERRTVGRRAEVGARLVGALSARKKTPRSCAMPELRGAVARLLDPHTQRQKFHRSWRKVPGRWLCQSSRSAHGIRPSWGITGRRWSGGLLGCPWSSCTSRCCGDWRWTPVGGLAAGRSPSPTTTDRIRPSRTATSHHRCLPMPPRSCQEPVREASSVHSTSGNKVAVVAFA
jgi:hypothetical protein